MYRVAMGTAASIERRMNILVSASVWVPTQTKWRPEIKKRRWPKSKLNSSAPFHNFSSKKQEEI